MRCSECERSYALEETRFKSAREANGADFICRMCVLGSRLDRLEQDKDKLAKRVGKLEKELQIEQKQRKEAEEKLANAEIQLSATILQSNDERIEASTANGAGSDASAETAEPATPVSSGANVSDSHEGDTTDAVGEENKAKGKNKKGGEGIVTSGAAFGGEGEGKRRVVFVGDSNMRKVEPAIAERVGADERVQVSALPGKPIREVIAKAKERMWDTMEERHLVVIMGGVIDVLNGRGAGITKQIAKGVTDLRNVSKEVQIAVCTVPEVERQGYKIERAVLAVNREIWTLAKAMNFTVIDINREVHRAGREGAFVRDGIHFSKSVATPVGNRFAARAVAFLGGPQAIRKQD